MQDRAECPQQPKPQPIRGKRYFGVPDWVWVVLVGAVLLISSVVAYSFLIVDTIGKIGKPSDKFQNYSSEVIIAEGGNFSYYVGYYSGYDVEITLDIASKDGKRFDVYIMDSNEHENAYVKSTWSNISVFSARYVKENITQIVDVINLSDLSSRYSTFYLVVDNRNTTLTPNDAIPTGTITIDVKIKIKATYRSTTYLY